MGDVATPYGRVPDAEAIAAFRDRPGVWLSFAGSAFLLAYAERLRPIGLKPHWVTALAVIAQQPRITQSALGRALRINRASAMALAMLLETGGFIDRAAATGRQRTTLMVSDRGQSSLAEAYAIEEQLVAATMPLEPRHLASFVETLRQVSKLANAID